MNIKKRVHVRVPIRVDLAGGTLDLWPLYLLLEKPTTVNFGINLHAECWLTYEPKATRPGVTLLSRDQEDEQFLGWEELHGEARTTTVVLPQLLLSHFQSHAFRTFGRDEVLSSHLRIETLGRSPKGAGLGGSSALTIALTAALYSWAHQWAASTDKECLQLAKDWIEISKDTESKVLYGPAGLQDYYGALFGGVRAYRWDVHEHEVDEAPEASIPWLEERIALFYSGQSRNSGINNWALYQDFLNRRGSTSDRFQKLADSARAVWNSILAKDSRALGTAIASEWAVRSTLAPGISTPEIDAVFAEAPRLGATAWKICGAGGGGCFFLYFPDGVPSDLTLDSFGVTRLDYKIEPNPIRIRYEY